jgi:hypothetical protein
MNGTHHHTASAITAAQRRIENHFSSPISVVGVLTAAHDQLAKALDHLQRGEFNDVGERMETALQLIHEGSAKASTARQRTQLTGVLHEIENARRIFQERRHH